MSQRVVWRNFRDSTLPIGASDVLLAEGTKAAGTRGRVLLWKRSHALTLFTVIAESGVRDKNVNLNVTEP